MTARSRPWIIGICGTLALAGLLVAGGAGIAHGLLAAMFVAGWVSAIPGALAVVAWLDGRTSSDPQPAPDPDQPSESDRVPAQREPAHATPRTR